MKVLVVEDDARLARFLTRVIRDEGYVADLCANGADAVKRATAGAYDVVVLDWMLPGMDGLAVCRKVREDGVATPILMLTARGELGDKILGLDSGADDYLVKPFEIDEFLARIRALTRRSTGLGRLQCGELEVDLLSRRALVAGTPVELTTREFALLLHLVQRMAHVVPKSELLSHVWGIRFDPGTNVVEVHVSRLRDKLGACAWMVETVRGEGYRMRAARGVE